MRVKVIFAKSILSLQNALYKIKRLCQSTKLAEKPNNLEKRSMGSFLRTHLVYPLGYRFDGNLESIHLLIQHNRLE